MDMSVRAGTGIGKVLRKNTTETRSPEEIRRVEGTEPAEERFYSWGNWAS